MVSASAHASHAVFGGEAHGSRHGDLLDHEPVSREQSDYQQNPSSPAGSSVRLCSASMTCIGAALAGGVAATERGTPGENVVATNVRTMHSLPSAPDTPPPRV